MGCYVLPGGVLTVADDGDDGGGHKCSSGGGVDVVGWRVWCMYIEWNG
jgi:hypothetical protein